MERCPTLATLALAAFLGAPAMTGCGGPPVVPPFADTADHSGKVVPAYPAGPYGVAIGSVVADRLFYGYPSPQLATDSLQPIRLADFYNPHGKTPGYSPPAGTEDDRYFPKSSPNAGKLKPTALLLEFSASWCGPCMEQAAEIAPAKHALYAPCGGEFMLQLIDGPRPGTPATPDDLTDWTTQFSVDYSAVIDPAQQLFPLWQQGGFPQNIVIDTTTMKIAADTAGEVVASTCNQHSICTVDADCQKCAGYCMNSSKCSPTNPCKDGSTCVSFCGDGSACQTSADCAQKACTTTPFWSGFEALLDKSRAGCTLK